MSFREELAAAPERFDFLGTLRRFERALPDEKAGVKKKPRIGDNTVLAEEVVRLGQDPFLAFPDSNISEFRTTASGTPAIQARFLGFFGPQGALPLITTVEAYHWSAGRDPSFARFTNIFSNRFLQLFFRAWADARPIAQFDRPDEDRFAAWLGSIAGIGTPALGARDSVPDIAKLGYSGLASGRAKSAAELNQIIRGLCGVEADIIERTGGWLAFEPDDRSQLGAQGSTLGSDIMLGGRVFSINDKFRLCIRAADFRQYESFLPGGAMAERLADTVFFAVGFRFEWDVELALPAESAPPLELDGKGRLGLTSWLGRKTPALPGAMLTDARYHPMQRRMGAGGGGRRKDGNRGGAAKAAR